MNFTPIKTKPRYVYNSADVKNDNIEKDNYSNKHVFASIASILGRWFKIEKALLLVKFIRYAYGPGLTLFFFL